MCDGHVPDPKFIEHAQRSHAAINVMTPLDADQRCYLLVLMGIYDSCNKKIIMAKFVTNHLISKERTRALFLCLFLQLGPKSEHSLTSKERKILKK